VRAWDLERGSIEIACAARGSTNGGTNLELARSLNHSECNALSLGHLSIAP